MGLFNMNSVKFRCLRSGNLVSFSLQGDIDGMRKHEGYKEVIENADENVKQDDPVTVVQKRGRPKQAVPSFLQG